MVHLSIENEEAENQCNDLYYQMLLAEYTNKKTTDGERTFLKHGMTLHCRFPMRLYDYVRLYDHFTLMIQIWRGGVQDIMPPLNSNACNTSSFQY